MDLFKSVAARPPATLLSGPPKLATNTLLAYEADLRGFSAWCCEQQQPSELPVPPKLVASYLYFLWATQKRRRSTVERAMFAIGSVHDNAGLPNPIRDPIVKSAWRTILESNERGRERKLSLLTESVRTVLATMRDLEPRDEGEALRLLRDRALILMYYAGALKRDELRLLTFERIVFATDGVRVTVASGDQKPRDVDMLAGRESLTDPVAALRVWLEASKITAGIVFRGIDAAGELGAGAIDQRSIVRAIQSRCKRAGIDPAMVATMSLRTGFVVEAARGGAALEEIAGHTGHCELGVRHIEDLVRRGRRLRTIDHPGRALGL